MDVKGVRRRCEAAVRVLDVAAPLDVAALARQVSARRGRAIHLLPKGTPAGPCGLWLALPSADYVFFEAATSGWHRDHIILHELGHLVNEHPPSQQIDHEVVRDLLPSLDPTMVRHVLGRSSYTAVEEQEAEIFASLVQERAARPRATNPGAPGEDSGVMLIRLTPLRAGLRPATPQ